MNLVKNGFLGLILIVVSILTIVGNNLTGPVSENTVNVVEKQELIVQKPQISLENLTGPIGATSTVFIEPQTTKNTELGQFFGDIIQKNEQIITMPIAMPVNFPIPKPTPTPVLSQNTTPDIFITDITEYELEMAKKQVGELVNVGLRIPVRKEGLTELLKLLEGFGDYFKLPFDALHDPNGTFALSDINLVKKTIEVYHNPVNVTLGEECGLEGPAFSYPPGRNDYITACGGTPGFGGTSCNTDAECFYTGFCFSHTYSYKFGSWTYCWVPSCYGVCGMSTYIWDSVTGICGCGV